VRQERDNNDDNDGCPKAYNAPANDDDGDGGSGGGGGRLDEYDDRHRLADDEDNDDGDGNGSLPHADTDDDKRQKAYDAPATTGMTTTGTTIAPTPTTTGTTGTPAPAVVEILKMRISVGGEIFCPHLGSHFPRGNIHQERIISQQSAASIKTFGRKQVPTLVYDESKDNSFLSTILIISRYVL